MMESTLNKPRAVTLSEVLDARECRAELQKKLLREYNATLVSFTMNIAGPIKNTPLIERAFRHGWALLADRLPREKVLFEFSCSKSVGCEGMIAIDLDAATVKEICVEIEEASLMGRLFDMDVIDRKGRKLERKLERGCIVCGKGGRECAAGRLHSVDDIVAVTNNIMFEHFAELDARRIGNRQNSFSVPYLKGTKTDANYLTLAVYFLSSLSVHLLLMC